MSSTVERNSQIIRVLCLGTGTSEQILNVLTVQFPTTAWTLDQLETFLLAGAKSGIYTKVSINPDRWQIRRDMVVVNNKNSVYQSLCPQIQKVYSTCNTSAATAT